MIPAAGLAGRRYYFGPWAATSSIDELAQRLALPESDLWLKEAAYALSRRRPVTSQCLYADNLGNVEGTVELVDSNRVVLLRQAVAVGTTLCANVSEYAGATPRFTGPLVVDLSYPMLNAVRISRGDSVFKVTVKFGYLAS